MRVANSGFDECDLAAAGIARGSRNRLFLAPERRAAALALDGRASGVEWRLAGYGGLPGGSKSAPVDSWSGNSGLPPKK